MKKNVHPAVAALIILVALCAAGYWIWSSNLDAPIPDKFIPPSEGARIAQGMAGGKGPAPAARPGGKGPGAGKMEVKAPDAAMQDEQPASKEGEKPAAKEDASAK